MIFFKILIGCVIKTINKIRLNAGKFPRFFGKYGTTIICSGGFMFQFQMLLDENLSGNTVVSIRVGKFMNETLPAFTLCYLDPFMVSIEKLAQMKDLNELNLFKMKVI